MQGDFPKAVFDLLQQQMAATGRIGATRHFVTPVITTPSAAGGLSAAVPVRFTSKGVALAMYGQEAVAATPASFAQTAMRLQIGGTEDFFTDAQGGPAFCPFLALFGTVNNWTSIMRRVDPAIPWVFTFQNNTAAGPISPQVVVSVIADEDIARMTQALRG